jgi:hypothetical protein
VCTPLPVGGASSDGPHVKVAAPESEEATLPEPTPR